MNEAFNMDCMEYMRTLPDKAFDLAVVDPPYGGGSQIFSVDGKLKGGHTDWESKKRSRFGGLFDKYYRGAISSTYITSKLVFGDGEAGRNGMSRYDYLFLNGKSLMFWALEWFSISNDAFFHCYGFNFNPHKYPVLYEQAQTRYFSQEANL